MNMKINIANYWALTGLLAVAACAPTESMVETGKKKSAEEGVDQKAKLKPNTNEPFDYEKNCGIKLDNADADPILFSQNLKSIPFVIREEKLGLKIAVTVTARAKAEARKSGNNASTNISVDNVEVDGSSPILKTIGLLVAKGQAKTMAEKQNGRQENIGLPTAELLNMTADNPEYKDIVCGVAFLKGTRDFRGGEHGEVEFTPGVVGAINVMASKETIEKEIGSGRTFNITGNITKTRSDWPKAGPISGTVTIKPVKPSFSVGSKSYSADIAYQVKIDFPPPPGKKQRPSYASDRIMYIDTTKKSIVAIIDQTNLVSNEGTKLPKIVLLPE
jgi:hypothetical protein